MFTVQLLLLAVTLQNIKDVQKSGSMFCDFPAVTDCTINGLCAFRRIHQKREGLVRKVSITEGHQRTTLIHMNHPFNSNNLDR